MADRNSLRRFGTRPFRHDESACSGSLQKQHRLYAFYWHPGSQRPAQQTRQTAKNISLGTPVTGTAPHKQASVNPTVAKPVNTGKPPSEKPARKQRGIKK